MLHTWKPLHSLSISHVFRTEGAPCLPAEEQSKLPHGDQRERQGQEHACPHAGWFVLWGQLLPKPGLLVGCNRCSAIQPQIPHWPGNGSGRVRQRGVQTASMGFLRWRFLWQLLWCCLKQSYPTKSGLLSCSRWIEAPNPTTYPKDSLPSPPASLLPHCKCGGWGECSATALQIAGGPQKDKDTVLLAGLCGLQWGPSALHSAVSSFG